MRQVAIFILSIPLLFMAVAWFCFVAPLMCIFAVPIWGTLDLISLLRGEDAQLPGILKSVFLMGFDMYGETTGFYHLNTF